MTLAEWSRSNVDYGRKLMHSAMEGVQRGEGDFLEEGTLAPYFARVSRKSVVPAVAGAVGGICCGYLLNQRRSTYRAVAGGILGAAIGFSAGMLWETRSLAASVGSGVRKNVRRTRDEHWFEKHPIDYA